MYFEFCEAIEVFDKNIIKSIIPSKWRKIEYRNFTSHYIAGNMNL